MKLIITHIIRKDEWERVKDKTEFQPDSLKTEGFIHCSNVEQVCKVADYNFKGNNDLLLLCIDTKKLVSEVVWEDLKNKGEKFPHVYGIINTSSIVKVFSMHLSKSNRFELTDEINKYFKTI